MTKIKIGLKYISPGILNKSTFRKEAEKVLKEYRDILKKDCELVTRTWDHKVDFKTDFKNKNDETSVSVSTTDDIFRFLDQGTKERWAVMSSNWKSKTRRGLIGSIRGKGHVVIAGRRAMTKRNIKVRPGIEKREFLKNIQDIRTSGFERKMQKAFETGAKNAWK